MHNTKTNRFKNAHHPRGPKFKFVQSIRFFDTKTNVKCVNNFNSLDLLDLKKNKKYGGKIPRYVENDRVKTVLDSYCIYTYICVLNAYRRELTTR